LGGFGQMTPKTSNEIKTLAGRALSCGKLRLLSLCARNYLYPFWPVQERKKKRQEGRKKSHKKCIFRVRVEQSLVGGFQPNLAHVFVLTDVIMRE